MNAKTYIEGKYNLTLDEPFSYYNDQWLSWMEEYADYRVDLQQPNIEGDSMNMEILDYNPTQKLINKLSFEQSFGNGYR